MGRGDSGAKRAIKKHDRDKKVRWRVYMVKNRNWELEELLRDPDFIESLEQMRRGEGRVIHPEEFDAMINAVEDRSYIELEGEGAERAAEILRRRGKAQ